MKIREQCKKLVCPNYVEWSFGYGTCYSCKLAGQSEDIVETPEDCIHKDKIMEL